MTLWNNFIASVCFLRKSVNKTFIVQNCAKIPTKKKQKHQGQGDADKHRRWSVFFYFFIFWIIGRNRSLLIWKLYIKVSLSYNSNWLGLFTNLIWPCVTCLWQVACKD
jgi:hypothetical protein